MKKSILIPYEKYQRLMKQQHEQPIQKQAVQHEQPTPKQQYVCIEEEDQHGGSGLQSDHILDSMPQRYKNKVGVIVSHILRDPQNTLSWNDAGELIYKGSIISGSHIVDLLKDSQYQHKGHQLKGTKEFYKGLQEIHLPSTLTRLLTNDTPAIRPPGIPQKKLKKWIHV